MNHYKTWHNGKKFVFEGEDVKVMDDNVHALMQKIKRLKIGVDTDNSHGQKRKRTNTS
jgi:hypothetical protein